jgi:hypothetical protein
VRAAQNATPTIETMLPTVCAMAHPSRPGVPAAVMNCSRGAPFRDRCGARLGASTSGAAGGRHSDDAEALRRLAPMAYRDRMLAAGGKMVAERRILIILSGLSPTDLFCGEVPWGRTIV